MNSEGELSLSLQKKIDAVCTRFETAWKSGAQPHLEEFLLDLAGYEKPATLRELILLDIYYRRQCGASCQVADFQARFPDLATDWLTSVCTAAAAPNFPPTMDAASGKNLSTHVRYFGDYELLDTIARGGMGIVYKARQISLSRLTALKMILSGHFATPAEVQRFRSEAEAAAQLDHPNIVPIYEIGDFQGWHFFSMKFIEGGSLASRRSEFVVAGANKSGARRQQARVATLLAQVARAVHYAHQHNVLHRDLKPANILIDGLGQPHVTDFGLARRMDCDSGQTQSGAVVGTPSYMAPEQAAGAKALTTQADVYGLGAVLYELLTDRPPFKSATVLETLRHVRDREPDRPRSLCPVVDRDLETICLKCLEKEPARRYGSGEALADDLERYLHGEPITARPVTMIERMVKWMRRKPASVALISSIIGALGLTITGLWWQAQTASARRLERTVAEARARLVVEAAIDLADESRKKFRFDEARATLVHATNLLAADSPNELQDRVSRATDDLAFARELDAIRMRRSIWIAAEAGKGRFDFESAAPAYRAVFLAHGLDVATADPASVAEKVRASVLRGALVAALDDWAILEPSMTLRNRMLTAVRLVDPGPWLDRYRDPDVRASEEHIRTLVQSADLSALSPGTITALAELMARNKMDTNHMLLRAQFAHPTDFLIPFSLGLHASAALKNSDAIAHYRAARAARPDVPALLINLGQALMRTGDREGHLECCREAARLVPDLPLAHYNLGDSLFNSGDIKGAVQCAREAIRLDPKFARAHTNLGVALKALGKVDEAMASLREALRLDPTLAMAHASLGHGYHLKGDTAAAVASYREALRIDPQLGEVHNWLGMILCAMGEPAEAEKSFQSALRLNPKHVAALTNFGAIRRFQGDPDGAIPYLRKAILIDPKFAPAHLELGYALRLTRNTDGAMAAFREAIRLDPETVSSHYILGLLLLERRDLNAAAAEFYEVIRLDPNHAKAHDSLGQVLREKGDLPRAISEFRQAICIDPNFVSAYTNLGTALRAAGEIDGAENMFREAIRINPRHKIAHVNLGALLCDLKNDTNQAERSFREALRLDPNFMPALTNLGVVLAKKGDHDGAIELFQKAIQLDPKEVQCRFNLGMGMRAKGRLDEAIESFRTVLRLNPKHPAAQRQLEAILEQKAKRDAKTPPLEAAKKQP
jgi:eukaryotic-like serine/threonine-protein kinase